MKSKNNLTLNLFLMITSLILIFLFLEFVGLADVAKYILYYLVFHLIFLGMRVWLKHKWIGLLPSIILVIGMFVFIVLVIFNANLGDSFGRVLSIGIAISLLMFAFFSYFASTVAELFLIEDQTIDLFKQVRQDSELFILVISIFIWIRYFFMLSGTFHRLSYEPLMIILITNIVILVISGVVVAFLYLLLLRKFKMIVISLIACLVFFPFSFLIRTEDIRIIITMGVIAWLIVFSLGLSIYKKQLKDPIKHEQEKGELL